MNFSVIIPIYNVAPYLTRCLDSILNQNYHDCELILVNDGSTDSSLQICKKYESRFQNVTVITQQNQGSGPARNAGMRKAKGKYLYFCDPDDYLGPGFFEHAESYITQEPELVVLSYWDVEQKNDQVLNKTLVNIEENKQLNRNEFRNHFVELFSKNILYTLWNKLYRRDFLEHNKIHFTAAPMGQDTRFNLQLYPLVSNVQLVNRPFYHYITNREGSSTEKYRENRAKLQLEEIKLLEKVIERMNLKDNNLLRKLRINVLLGNSNHIANSNIGIKEKRVALKDLLSMDIIQKVLKEDVGPNGLSMKLLKREQVELYLILKHIQYKFL